MALRVLPCVVLVFLGACQKSETKETPLKAMAPEPLPPLAVPVAGDAGEVLTDVERLALHQPVPAAVYGEPLPRDAVAMQLDANGVRWSGKTLALSDAARLELPARSRVLLEVADDVFLAQAAGVLQQMLALSAEVHLKHPSANVAFPIELKTEEMFRSWLDEPLPGQLRVIHRADGFELQTAVGKLPGADPNGPTVPTRGGRADLATLRLGLQRLKKRFTQSPDLCFVPSHAMELKLIAAALTGNYAEPEEPIFSRTCLVFPRPFEQAKARDGGP